jgi:hypothetical protein
MLFDSIKCARVPPEPLVLHGERIGAHWQIRYGIKAGLIGDGRIGDIRTHVGYGHLGAWNNGAWRIAHHAADRSLVRLRERNGGGKKDE